MNDYNTYLDDDWSKYIREDEDHLEQAAKKAEELEQQKQIERLAEAITKQYQKTLNDKLKQHAGVKKATVNNSGSNYTEPSSNFRGEKVDIIIGRVLLSDAKIVPNYNSSKVIYFPSEERKLRRKTISDVNVYLNDTITGEELYNAVKELYKQLVMQVVIGNKTWKNFFNNFIYSYEAVHTDKKLSFKSKAIGVGTQWVIPDEIQKYYTGDMMLDRDAGKLWTYTNGKWVWANTDT